MSSDDIPAKTLEVFRCNNCRLVFVGTPITSSELSSAYDAHDSASYYDEIGDTTSLKVARALRDVSPALMRSDDPSVLDVGCGYGHLLEVLRDRFPRVPAVGAELPGRPAEACRAKGLQVFTGDLGDIGEEFSLVVLLDVAEHLPAPIATLATCNAVMKPGGLLYIQTPRACFWDELSLVFLRLPGLCELGRIWLRSRISIFHLQLWTDQALRIALADARFDVVYLRRELGLSWPLERYWETYLGGRIAKGSPVARVVTALANLIFVRLGTLRNKAVVLAEKREG